MFSFVLLLTSFVASAVASEPPIALRVDHTITTEAGDSFVDPYYWLMDKRVRIPEERKNVDPRIFAYLKAENEYSDKNMASAKQLQTNIFEEMKLLRDSLDRSSFSQKNIFGEYEYTEKYEVQSKFPNLIRRNLKTGEEQTLIIGSELAGESSYFRFSTYSVSPNGRYLAFTYNNTGNRWKNVELMDLETGEISKVLIKYTVAAYSAKNLAWSSDSLYLFYASQGTTDLTFFVNRYSVTENQNTTIYTETDSDFFTTAEQSKDGEFIFINSTGNTSTKLLALRSNNPLSEPTLVADKKEGHIFTIQHFGKHFYIRSNLDDPKNNKIGYRLMVTRDDQPEVKYWKEVEDYDPNLNLRNLLLYDGYLVLHESKLMKERIRIFDLKTQEFHTVSTPQSHEIYFLSLEDNTEFESKTFNFKYQSHIIPRHTYQYNFKTRELVLVEKDKTPHLNIENYQAKRIWVPSQVDPDIQIPVTLYYKKGTELTGKNPMILTSYGHYGLNLPQNFFENDFFNVPVISMLNRNVVYAFAHVRGGGDLGEAWRRGANYKSKPKTFWDLRDTLKYLIKNNYTSRSQLALVGRSAGGLNVGWIVNNEPELVKAIVAEVPFVDAITTMLDTSIELTTQEYVLWGNPNIHEDFVLMKTYSPYDNVKQNSKRPSILAMTYEMDSSVGYWEAAKWVAKLRYTSGPSNTSPILLKVWENGGHIGSQGDEGLKETAYSYAFLLREIGIELK